MGKLLEQQRVMGYREIAAWYRQLPEEDQRMLSVAVQKQIDDKYRIVKPKGKNDGPSVHDNRS